MPVSDRNRFEYGGYAQELVELQVRYIELGANKSVTAKCQFSLQWVH